MKRKIHVEIFESHAKVNFYTIRFDGEESSEFDKFYDKFNEVVEFNNSLDVIVNWIDKIGENGALERYFRPEGGKLKALPVELSKLRLYCFYVAEDIILLGNGGSKKTKTYNEDPLLNDYAETLREVGTHLLTRIKKEQVTVYNKTLYHNLTFTINGQHA